jgi:hypothetical protein
MAEETKFFSSEKVRPSDGSKTYSYGQVKVDDSKNNIPDAVKGHVVTDKTGCITYVRTEDQRVIYDSKKDSSYVAPKS